MVIGKAAEVLHHDSFYQFRVGHHQGGLVEQENSEERFALQLISVVNRFDDVVNSGLAQQEVAEHAKNGTFWFLK